MTRIDKFTGDYRFLSNFYPVFIMYQDVIYPTLEHAYQAQKTLDEDLRLAIAATPRQLPGRAKRAGARLLLRPDWEAVRVSVMYELLKLKYQLGTDLAARLLETGNADLVEGNTWGDRFWGVFAGEGQNWLGRLTMLVRAELVSSLRETGVLCRCGIYATLSPHTCPFRRDVEADSTSLCTCCEYCIEQCSRDI